MSFSVTTYTDPSVYSQEVIVPTGLNIPAQPFAPCLVGVGSRNKRVTNEPVIRGIVTNETLTVSSTVSAHTAPLANRALKKLENTSVRRTLNGITTDVQDSYVSFLSPYVLGSVTSTVNIATNNAIALEMDGVTPITVVFHDESAQIGTNVAFSFSSGVVTLSKTGFSSFITNGIRPGHTVTVASSEDAGNDGTFTILTVTASAITYANASGVTNADDDTTTVDLSGTGFVGREVRVLYNFSNTAAATMAELVAATNQALAASTSLGYGSAYSTAASVSASAFKLTSPNSGSTSDVRVFAPFALSATTNIFGSASVDAATRIQITNEALWNASATWAADYVQVADDTDPLAQTSNVQRVLSVGSSAGSTNFIEATDWQLTSNQIDWSPDSAATITGVDPGGSNFVLTSATNLVLNVDDKTPNSTFAVSGGGTFDIAVDLTTLPTGYILGYTTDATPATVAASVVSANINAVLASALGPRYKAVSALNGSNEVVLTSPTDGKASVLRVKSAATLSAHTALFGATYDDPSPAMGTGRRPTPGTAYFVNYEYTRLSTEYDIPYRHFSVESALAQIGEPSAGTASYNPLAIAAQIAFENGSQYIYTCQVNDSSSEGNPSRAQVQASLDAAGTIALTTEVVVVGEPGTRLDVTTDVTDHLETQNGPIEKHRRRGFYGMASNTAIGDRDTPASLIGRATRTLQVGPASPARGRMFMLAPPQVAGVTRDQTLDDGQVARISLDATYLAVATAAKRCSFLSPSQTLTKNTITGFNTDDITAPWKPAERRAMASQGVLVVTYDAGRFVFRDAVTTEAGGGGLLAFQVDSTSYQKDVVVSKVETALDENAVGIVPFDLATFFLDIKLIIQGVISNEIAAGTIGPFRDKATGAIRLLDPRVDIRVAQDPNIPTNFQVAYFFMLRYPALRIFAQYSVDLPFFANA